MPQPDEIDLTVAEAATMLRVSPRTLYRYIEDGLLPGVWKTQGEWRIPRSAVTAYRERNAAAD